MMRRELFRRASEPIERRLQDLLERMTLDEKLAQLGCVWSTALIENNSFSHEKARRALANGTGHITRIGSSTGLRPRESAAFMNDIQRVLVEETRLGIPAIVHEESLAGFTARDATQFPQAIGLASTWEPELIEAMAVVIRDQMRAVGARQALAPVLDVARDPRWGRTEETYGEDPYLAGRMGVAYVRGLQTDNLATGVVATGKHFLGYGLSEGGLNHAPAHIGPRELREVFAEPFGAAIREAGLASVMNAYNSVDGLACGASGEILNRLLRGELGFDGVVVADYYTTALLITHHRVAADKGEAAQKAIEAGLDVELPELDCYGAPLRERIDAGALPVEVVDCSVRRLLRTKFELGLFEKPYVDQDAAAEVYDTPEQRRLAREIARKSIVLLKNDEALLPLDPGIASIAVIGPAAADIRLYQGDYSYPAHVEIVFLRDSVGEGRAVNDITPAGGGAFAPGPYFVPTVSLLDGVRAAVSPDTEVLVAEGCGISDPAGEGIAAAVDAARRAKVAIVAVGGRSGLMPECTSGEFRDAADLGLTGAQEQLVEAVVATGTPTIVAIIGGRAFSLPWIAEHVPSVLEAWIPGEEGGNAIADVLFGAVSPGGRLPISMPRSVGQVPVFYNHKSGGGRSQMLGDYSDLPTTPLFPFGHGLSYTSFTYENLRVAPSSPTTAERLMVSVDVTNSGAVDADEVVQLYLHDEVAKVARPNKQLAGFKRIALTAGETRTVRFTVHPSQLAYYEEEMRLIIEPGTVQIMIGASSADIRVEAVARLHGEIRQIRPSDIKPTTVDVD